jgi:HNH endonuclease
VKKRKSSKPKPFKKSLARRILHALWSHVVRERDGYRCQWCLHDGRVNTNIHHHAHHIVSRALSGTNGAFDVKNGVTLCYYCHIQRLKSEVDEYIAFRDRWLEANVGEDYGSLREKFSPITKFTEEFYATKLDSLEFIRNSQDKEVNRECR